MVERWSENLKISLCGIVLEFISQTPLRVSASLEKFCCAEPAQVKVQVRCGKKHYPGRPLAKDLLNDYARDGEKYYAAASLPENQTMIMTEYDAALEHVTVWINPDEFGESLKQYKLLLQHFPVRELLVHYNALMLHASRIAFAADRGEERAILFSAPSQTGKTTQANLWAHHPGIRLVSNDKTIIRVMNGRIVTGGYPVDGSSPAADAGIIPLSAIIVLRQGAENTARRLKAAEAMRYLNEQTAVDAWNPQELSAIRLLWADILTVCPVWLYACRPEESAVIYLKEKLEQDGGICIGKWDS